MTAIRFTRKTVGFTVTFRYDPTLVELLKSVVPSFARSWHPDRRVWHIDDDCAEGFAAVAQALGHTVVGIEPEPPPRATRGTDSGSSDQWARILLRAVGPSRHEPVFRALTRVLHPDNAVGDTRLMQQLNEARAAVAKGKP